LETHKRRRKLKTKVQITLDLDRDIVKTGITSSEYLKQVQAYVKPEFFAIPEYQRIWCWIHEHYRQHGLAIGADDFQDKYKLLFEPKLKREADRELIEAALVTLSNEYAKEGDIKSERLPNLVYKTQVWAKEMHFQVFEASLSGLSREETIKAMSEYSSLSTGTEAGLIVKMEPHITVINEFIREDIVIPRQIISPWLTQSSIVEIYAPKGVGKTLLLCLLTTGMSRKQAVGLKIGNWEITNQAGTLYLDGEMGESDMQQRLRMMEHTLGEMDHEYPFKLLSSNRFGRCERMTINLTKPEFQEALYEILEKDKSIDVLVLDNIGSLTAGIDENVKKDWDPVNQWLLSVKGLGMSVIFIHHSGKSGEQRGTSAREDNVDCVIKLYRPKDYRPEMGAYFSIKYEKARNVVDSSLLVPFSLHIKKTEDGGVEWKTSEIDASLAKEEVIVDLMTTDLTGKEIAKKWRISESLVARIKKKAVSKKFMDNDRTPTLKGRDFLHEYDKGDEEI